MKLDNGIRLCDHCTMHIGPRMAYQHIPWNQDYHTEPRRCWEMAGYPRGDTQTTARK